MRFAVHRPGIPEASPRMKGAGEAGGVPRRDVDGRVHVGVAGETAGSAPEHGLALTRVPVHLPARRAPLAGERGADLLHPARGLVLQPAHQQPPPRTQDRRFSPALARTLRPGSSRVPFADRVMAAIFRSSTPITSNRRAMPVDTFSAQSLRRSLSRARSRAIKCFTRPRRFDPRLARASVRRIRRSLIRSRAVSAGQCSRSPVDRAAETATPGRCPPSGRYRGRQRAPGSPRTRHASGPPGPGSPGRTSRPAAPRGTSGTAPTRPLAPRPDRFSG